MRCLQCGSETSPKDKRRRDAGEFCSRECREKFFHESNQLAIQRLRQQWEINRASASEPPPIVLPAPPASEDPPQCEYLPELTFLKSGKPAPPLPEPVWTQPDVNAVLPVSRFLTDEIEIPSTNETYSAEIEPIPAVPNTIAVPIEPIPAAPHTPAAIVFAVEEDEAALPPSKLAQEARTVHTISGWWGKLRIAKPRPAPAALPPDPLLPTGLDSWRTEWTSDSTGTPRARQLTLYTPSRRLRDYALQFDAELDTQTLGWALRVQNSSSYYCFKLTRTESGLRLIRFATIGGAEDRPFEVPVPNSPVDSPLHVRAEAHGPVLATSVNGRVVDTWTDDRLARGSFGFVIEQNHRAAIRAVQITFAVQPPFGVARQRSAPG